MSELKEYLAPLVMPQKKIRPLLKSLKSSWSILIHGILPHQSAVQPEKLFFDEHIGSEEEYMAELAMELYKESTARIDALEEKGFKLLTYISAISAISVYFIGKELDGFFKYTVIASLLFLVIAIVISLRCIGIKQQKALFIDSLFKFETDAAPSAQSKKAIIASLINCAVFN
ncbi:hypothetical protein [Pedobacter miscanthi]|uniref:Uncharacterized protein n=1 Tax=Pedobacter miscanthi TaxID=2259170 RepID=A0A366KYI3_9SPHI|nr:hypothetical protein [Pedobacter miscanthi]RBQ06701.1 hypothetical protein DRW42_13020 [Pedobacter miscanthi]